MVQMKINKKQVAIFAAVTIAIGTGSVVWQLHHREQRLPVNSVYNAAGYGGIVAAPTPSTNNPKRTNSSVKSAAQSDSVQPAIAAYQSGKYRDAEASALQVVAHAAKSQKTTQQAVEARQVLAYAAARRHDLKLAQQRFTVMRQEAAKLPDKGKELALPGEITPTMEQEAAYEHAVCTSALGNSAAAETEFCDFMKAYPNSPLVEAAIKRIAHMHGGDIPKADDALWREAQKFGLVERKAKAREESLCGPECLAELLRRCGTPTDVHQLADEMKTTDRGTTLQALADTAHAHGFAAQGLALTQTGLEQQKLPVIVLLRPGHYVIVDKITPEQITLWDPNADISGKGGQAHCPTKAWAGVWQGVTLALQPLHPAIQTATREQ